MIYCEFTEKKNQKIGELRKLLYHTMDPFPPYSRILPLTPKLGVASATPTVQFCVVYCKRFIERVIQTSLTQSDSRTRPRHERRHFAVSWHVRPLTKAHLSAVSDHWLPDLLSSGWSIWASSALASAPWDFDRTLRQVLCQSIECPNVRPLSNYELISSPAFETHLSKKRNLSAW